MEAFTNQDWGGFKALGHFDPLYLDVDQKTG